MNIVLIGIKKRRDDKIMRKYKCLCCHRMVTDNFCVHLKSGGVVCKGCSRTHNYRTPNNLKVGKETKQHMTYGLELECIPYSNEDIGEMCHPKYKLIPTRDRSLPYNGIEFKTPIYNNLIGMKQRLSIFAEHVDFSNIKCGQHINIGNTQYINSYTMKALQPLGDKIFNPLYNYLWWHKDMTKLICGRFFNTYATEQSSYKKHYSWISLKKNNCIEYRLSKFNSVEQYYNLLKLWSDVTQCLIDNLIKPYKLYQRISLKISERAIATTSQKILKIYIDYENNVKEYIKYS